MDSIVAYFLYRDIEYEDVRDEQKTDNESNVQSWTCARSVCEDFEPLRFPVALWFLVR